MAKMIQDMSKEELANEILCNEDGLYEMFNEESFLADEITHETLLNVTEKWIEDNNEALV